MAKCNVCESTSIETSGPDHMPIYCKDCNSTDIEFTTVNYEIKDQEKTKSFVELTKNLANCPHCENGIISHEIAMNLTKGKFLGDYIEKFRGYYCPNCDGKGVVKLTEKLGEGSEKDERGEGMRYNVDKVPIECVPIHLINGASYVFKHVTEREQNPYPMWNWARGMKWSVPYACMLRHLEAWYRGEDNDKETGLNHLHHVMCNLLMLTHYLDAYPEGDDRPKEYFQPGGMKDDKSTT